MRLFRLAAASAACLLCGAASLTAQSEKVGFPSRRPGLTLHVAKVPEGSQTQSESTLALPSDCPTK